MAAPSLEAARCRACASHRVCIRSRSFYWWLRPIGLAFAAAHFIGGCALSGLHSQPLILLVAAPYRACIRSRSFYWWLRPIGLAFAAAHQFGGPIFEKCTTPLSSRVR